MIKTTEIKDVKVLKPKIFSDNRGYVFESYNDRSSSMFSFLCDFPLVSILTKPFGSRLKYGTNLKKLFNRTC